MSGHTITSANSDFIHTPGLRFVARGQSSTNIRDSPVDELEYPSARPRAFPQRGRKLRICANPPLGSSKESFDTEVSKPLSGHAAEPDDIDGSLISKCEVAAKERNKLEAELRSAARRDDMYMEVGYASQKHTTGRQAGHSLQSQVKSRTT